LKSTGITTLNDLPETPRCRGICATALRTISNAGEFENLRRTHSTRTQHDLTFAARSDGLLTLTIDDACCPALFNDKPLYLHARQQRQVFA